MFHIRRKDNQKVVANLYDIKEAIRALEMMAQDVYELVDDEGKEVKEENETSL